MLMYLDNSCISEIIIVKYSMLSLIWKKSRNKWVVYTQIPHGLQSIMVDESVN